MSDHHALLATVEIGTSQTASTSRFWRFPAFLFDDTEAIEQIKKVINRYFAAPHPDIFTQWEYFKDIFPSEVSIIQKAARRRVKAKKTANLSQNQDGSDVLLQSFATGFNLQGQFDWTAPRRALSNKGSHTFKELHIDGRNYSDPGQIRDAIVATMTQLYTDQQLPNAPQRLLAGLPKLDDSDNTMLGALPTVEEIALIIKSLHNNKCPGPDGLPNEFYKVFSEQLSPIIHRLILRLFHDPHPPPSFLRSFTIFIPKKGDLSNFESWRPITMLNSDYKVFSRLMSIRIASIADRVISHEQTYSLKGRTILANTCATRDILWFSHKFHQPIVVVSLDQRRAFDSVAHSFLNTLLKEININSKVIKIIQLLYQQGSSHLLINGSLTPPIAFNRGVRQGDPSSGVLYSLFIEPLTLLLKETLRRDAFTVGNVRIPLLIYADDITIFVKSPDPIVKAFDCFSHFGEFSGASLNVNKSQLYSNISGLTSITVCNQVLESRASFKSLGIVYGKAACDRLNYGSLIAKLNTTAARLKPLLDASSYKDRVRLIKSYLVSRALYTMNIIAPTPRELEVINRILVQAFWARSRRNWLSHKILKASVASGGLNFPDIKTRYRVCLIRRFARLANLTTVTTELKVFTAILNKQYSTPNGLVLFYSTARSFSRGSCPPEYRKLWVELDKIQFAPTFTGVGQLMVQPAYHNRFLQTIGVSFPEWHATLIEYSIDDVIRANCALRGVEDFANRITDGLAGYFTFNEIFAAQTASIPLNLGYMPVGVVDGVSGLGDGGRLASVKPNKLYKLLQEQEFTPPNQDLPSLFNTEITWNSCWNKFIPGRVGDIIWRYLHSRLNSPRRRWRMGFIPTPVCDVCQCFSLNDQHVFEDCEFTHVLWSERRVLAGWIRRLVRENAVSLTHQGRVKSALRNIPSFLFIFTSYQLYCSRTRPEMTRVRCPASWFRHLFKLYFGAFSLIFDKRLKPP